MWQAVEEVAWQHMQVGLTDLGGIRSRSSSSGISSNRYPSFSSWMFKSWLICYRQRDKQSNTWDFLLLTGQKRKEVPYSGIYIPHTIWEIYMIFKMGNNDNKPTGSCVVPPLTTALQQLKGGGKATWFFVISDCCLASSVWKTLQVRAHRWPKSFDLVPALGCFSTLQRDFAPGRDTRRNSFQQLACRMAAQHPDCKSDPTEAAPRGWATNSLEILGIHSETMQGISKHELPAISLWEGKSSYL